jgi:hypothetical protein
MNLSPVDRRYVHFPVTAALADGTPVTLAGVDVAVLPFRTTPSAATSWAPASYSSGQATVLVTGPFADPTGALPLPLGGATLWARVSDNPEIQAVPVGFISVG